MDWIQTYRGRQFFPLRPRVEDLDIEDIAHALSLQCRFNGHCRVFYCVAEHSVHVCRLLQAQGHDAMALWGLLHDAAEAYLSDLPRPLKLMMPQFGQTEDALLRVIVEHFELSWPMPEAVRRADDVLLATEARDVMAPPPAPWVFTEGLEALPDRIVPVGAEQAESDFLACYEQLTAPRAAS